MKLAWVSVAWAYAVEAVLVALLYALAARGFGVSRLASFIHETGDEWASMTGVLFAASLTIWIVFVNVAATDFGGYLRYKKCYTIYSAAFVFAMLIFCTTTATLIVASSSVSNVLWGNVSFVLLVYSLITIVTMVRNATGLVRAHAKFKIEWANVVNEPRRTLPEPTRKRTAKRRGR